MAQPAPKTPDSLRDRMRAVGCPYEPGSAEAVIWLHGYRAGALAGSLFAITGEMPGGFRPMPAAEGRC